MSQLDIVLLIILGGFALFGFYTGFIRSVGNFIASILSFFISIRVYDPLSWLLGQYTGWSENTTRLVTFIILFILLNRVVVLLIWLLEKLVKDVIRVPFVKSLDRILGFVLGLAEGVLVTGIFFYFTSKFPVNDWLIAQAGKSQVVPIIIQPIQYLMPLLPQAFKTIQTKVGSMI